MAGTRQGGLKTARTNKLRHGKDFYVNIGKLGGSYPTTGGFKADRELAKIAGKKGGQTNGLPILATKPDEPEFTKEFKSMKEAAEFFGMNTGNFSSVAQYWLKKGKREFLYHGLLWKRLKLRKSQYSH